MRGFGIEPLLHLFEDFLKAAEINLSVKGVEYLYEPAHVRALELVGKVDVHVHGRNSVLVVVLLVENGDGIGYGFDPDLLYIDTSVIKLALNVFHDNLITCYWG